MTTKKFQQAILSWYRRNGRLLPWRKTNNPYKILVSEVMLQQTQVKRVLPKYAEFLKRFPNFQALENASLRDVLVTWHGLGYNRRALYLKRLAGKVCRNYGGKLPRSEAMLTSLPGIGLATAGAVAVFAFSKKAVFIETNIRRVFLHFFFKHQNRVSDKEILAEIRRTLPDSRLREWYYALMDYGAIALTTKNHQRDEKNPNRRSAHYVRQKTFRGSRRELRGRIIAALLHETRLSSRALARKVSAIRNVPKPTRPFLQNIESIVDELVKEGLLTKSRHRANLAKVS